MDLNGVHLHLVLGMELVYCCHRQVVAFLAIVFLEKQEVTEPFKNERRLGMLQSLCVFRNGVSIKANEVLVFARDEQHWRSDFSDLLVVVFLAPLAPSCGARNTRT